MAGEVEQMRKQPPHAGATAVTPDDSNDLPITAESLYIGGAGDVRVDTVESADVVFASVSAGTVLPVQVTRVYATNTTASSIVALF